MVAVVVVEVSVVGRLVAATVVATVVGPTVSTDIPPQEARDTSLPQGAFPHATRSIHLLEKRFGGSRHESPASDIGQHCMKHPL